jgi:hypothetical protein
MSLGNQNKRTTRPIDTQHLEELAKQSAHLPHSPERVLLPTSKIDPAALRGLLDLADPAVSTPPPARGMSGDLMTQRMDAVAIVGTVVDDRGMSGDLMTQRMEAEQFQALLQTSQVKQPSTPTALGSAPSIAVPASEPSPAAPPTPRQEERVATELLPIATSGTPRRRDAQRAMRPPVDLQRTLARIADQRMLINLVGLALIGVIVLVIAQLVLRS